MREKQLVYLTCLLIILILLTCHCKKDIISNSTLKKLSLEDIKIEYSIVDSLNYLSRNNMLNADLTEKQIKLGIDKRNNILLIRRCEDRLFGCIMISNVFGLFYDDCDSICCNEIDGIKIIDYEGFAGTPRYIGCSPDTSTKE